MTGVAARDKVEQRIRPVDAYEAGIAEGVGGVNLHRPGGQVVEGRIGQAHQLKQMTGRVLPSRTAGQDRLAVTPQVSLQDELHAWFFDMVHRDGLLYGKRSYLHYKTL